MVRDILVPEGKRLPLIFFGIAAIVGALAAISQFTAAVLLAVMFGLLGIWLIAVRPYWVVLFLTVLMPFEYFLLKFPPVSEQIYVVLRSVSEVTIYLTLAVLILQRVLKGTSLRRTPLDVPLVAFVAIALLSMIVNQSPVIGTLMDLRASLRYIVLFYIVVNLDLGQKQATTLMRIILFIGSVQIVLGGLQIAIGGVLNEFLIPRQVGLEVLGKSIQFRLAEGDRELGSIYGTLGDTIFFALFLLTVLGVYLGRVKKLNLWVVLFLTIILTALGFSYARGTVFGALFMLLIFYRVRRGLQRTLLLCFIMLLAGSLGLVFLLNSDSFNQTTYVSPVQSEQSILANITGVFSRDYIERAQVQRVGSLLGVVPTVLVNRPILGYGPVQKVTLERMNASQPSFLFRPWNENTAGVFEDVYWTAVLAYYGLIGVGAFVFLLYKLYSAAWRVYRKARENATREVALAVIYISGTTFFLLFFYRVLKYRVFSFYFWLLAALMFTLFAQEQKRRNCTSGATDSSSGLNNPAVTFKNKVLDKGNARVFGAKCSEPPIRDTPTRLSS